MNNEGVVDEEKDVEETNAERQADEREKVHPASSDSAAVIVTYGSKRFVWLACALYISLFTGIFIGYPSLKQPIMDTNVYTSLEIDLAYQVSGGIINLVAIFFGKFLDTYGPRWTLLFGTAISFLGYAVLVLCFVFELHVVFLCLGFLLSFGGSSPRFLSIIHIGNAFAAYSSLIVAILTGFWELSSCVGFVIETLHSSAGIGAPYLFGGIGVCIFSLIVPAFILPKETLAPARETFSSKSTYGTTDTFESAGANGKGGEEGEGEERGEREGEARGADTGTSTNAVAIRVDEGEATTHIFLTKEEAAEGRPGFTFPRFVLYAACVSSFMLQQSYYLTSVQSQLLWLTESSSEAKEGANRFTLMISFLGFAMSIGAGTYTKKFGCVKTFLLVATIEVLYGVLQNISNYTLQYFTCVLFLSWRVMLFSINNYYLMLAGGKEKMGVYLGAMYSVSGVFAFLGYFFIWVAEEEMNHNFLLSNLIVASMSTFTGYGQVVAMWNEGV